MVALYAVRDPELASRIDGVVALSTPFLIPRDRRLNVVGEYGVELIPRVVLPIVLLMVALKLFTSWLIAWLVTIICGGVLAGFGGYYYSQCVSWVRNTLLLPPLRDNQLYVVRGPADEANALLLGTQFLQFIVSSSWGRRGYVHLIVTGVNRFIRKIIDTDWKNKNRVFLYFPVFWVYLVLQAHGLVAPLPDWQGSPNLLLKSFIGADAPLGPKLFFVLYSPVAIFVVLIVCAISLILAFYLFVAVAGAAILIIANLSLILLMLPIAAEVGPFALVLDVSVEPAPPGEFPMRQIEAKETAGASNTEVIKHSATYSDPEALQAIANWISHKILNSS
jgi:hypothetical protein